MALWCGFSLWYLLVHASAVSAALLAVIGAACAAPPLILRRTGSITVAGFIAALLAFAGLVVLALLRGGFPVNIVMFSLAIPVTVAISSESRWIVGFWVGVVLLWIVGLYALNATGHPPAAVVDLPDDQRLMAEALSLVAMLVFLLYVALPMAANQRRVGAERDELQQRLEQAKRLEELGQLAGGVAHDFGNVLVGVTSGAELLAARLDDDDPRQKEVSIILEAADRGTSLARQLMAFARRGSSEAELVDVNQALQRVEPFLQRVLGSPVQVSLQLGGDLDAIEIDPRQLDRVLLNLAINARDAMPGGGELIIRSAAVEIEEELAVGFTDVPSGNYVRIEVEDTGCGMPAEIAEHIFEPFFTTKGAGLGTGLGLSSCYGIVKQAGGGITVDSKAGVGTLFRVYLPTASCEQRAARREIAAGNRERILVVDDEAPIRRVIERILRQSGYRVVTAADGDEALATVLRERDSIDLVLADIVMPNLPGTELRRRLASEPGSPAVIYMSGQAGRAGEPAPDGEVLEKPFSRAELLAQIRAHLDQGGGQRN